MARQDQEAMAIEPTAVDQPTGEVAIPADTPSEPDGFDKWLTDEKSREGEPDVSPHQRIIEQVLNASSPDEVLTPVEAESAKDMVGIPLILHGFDLNESEFDAGSPFYASMKCVNYTTGEPTVVNCGHKKMIAQLIKLGQFGQFPYNVMVKEQGRSKVSGSPMLALVKWTAE